MKDIQLKGVSSTAYRVYQQLLRMSTSVEASKDGYLLRVPALADEVATLVCISEKDARSAIRELVAHGAVVKSDKVNVVLIEV